MRDLTGGGFRDLGLYQTNSVVQVSSDRWPPGWGFGFAVFFVHNEPIILVHAFSHTYIKVNLRFHTNRFNDVHLVWKFSHVLAMHKVQSSEYECFRRNVKKVDVMALIAGLPH